MKYVAFDLEIYKEVPEGAPPLDYLPLGIACASIKTTKHPQVQLFFNDDYTWMSRAGCAAILFALETYVRNGFEIVTVNGAGFDFRVLAEETGQHERCARLAAGHIDFMAICLCQYGWRVGLDTLAKGAGHAGKLDEIVLKNDIIRNIDGMKVPAIWKADPEAVLGYQAQDADATLAIATAAKRRGEIRWSSNSGNPYSLPLGKLKAIPNLRHCMEWPFPDTSWMDNPPQRSDIISWINDALPDDEKIVLPVKYGGDK